jgi:DNA-binding response OmpR family regulator
MKKIVLIDDDTDLIALLKYNLEKEGFSLAGSQSGCAALELCRRISPDLILLDVMLPDSDGLDVCKGIRNESDLSAVPIIFLSACASETDRIAGLEAGANDYIVKPFFMRELIARIKLQFRTQQAPDRVLNSGGIELDRLGRQARWNGTLLALTATEFRLLEHLMRHPGALFSRQQLLDVAWGKDHAITDRSVDVYILRLRKKVERDPANPRVIHSVHGFGYTFDPRMNRAESEPAPGAVPARQRVACTTSQPMRGARFHYDGPSNDLSV